MEQMPSEGISPEVKKNKAEGFLDTIETLRQMNTRGLKCYAVLVFCDIILNELEKTGNRKDELEIIQIRINDLREAIKKDNDYDGESELSIIVEDVRVLVLKNK